MRTRLINIPILQGESAKDFPKIGHVTNKTVNWLPDNRGFLRTYRGDRNVYSNIFGGRMATSSETFVDVFGRKRRVIAADNAVYSLDGPDATLIYRYSSDLSDDGDTPEITFVRHQNMVIILHPNYVPLKWNGDEPVNFLGVREIPTTPTVITVAQATHLDYINGLDAWGTGHPPVSNLDKAGVAQAVQYRIAFVNSRGQYGKWSAPTGTTLRDPAGLANNLHDVPLLEWDRPRSDGPEKNDSGSTTHTNDITETIISRAGPVDVDLINAAQYNIIASVPYTQTRYTDNISPGAVSLQIDEDNDPPPSCSIGCSYQDIVLLSGNRQHPNYVYYSKPGFPEAYPTLNAYVAYDKVVAILGISDRVIVVTNSTIETIRYDGNSGAFLLLRLDRERGSLFGRSLVVRNDRAFGIFTSGYGGHNGFEFGGMNNDTDELFKNIDISLAGRVRAAIDNDGNYWLVVPRDSLSVEGGNYIYHYHFAFASWWKVKSSCGCLWSEDGQLWLGKDNAIALFDGGTSSDAAVLELNTNYLEQVDPSAIFASKNIIAIYAIIGSTGSYQSDVEVAYDDYPEPSHTAKITHNPGKPSFQKSKLDPVWNVALWDDDRSLWIDYRRVPIKAEYMSDTAAGTSIKVTVRTASNSYVELVGLNIEVEVEPTKPGF